MVICKLNISGITPYVRGALTRFITACGGLAAAPHDYSYIAYFGDITSQKVKTLTHLLSCNGLEFEVRYGDYRTIFDSCGFTYEKSFAENPLERSLDAAFGGV